MNNNKIENRDFKVGDTVIAWSNERYGMSKLAVCDVEEVDGDTLYLFAIEENRAFQRNRLDVMSYDELVYDFNRVTEDMKLYNEEEE